MKDLKPLLLIVEDDISHIKILEVIFKDEFRIIPRKSGEQAIQFFEKMGFDFSNSKESSVDRMSIDELIALKQNLPELILLDIEMPGIKGWEVCTRLKSISQLKDIPVIFISAMMDTEDITHGFKVGAVDYLTKPFNAAELKARVHTHLTLKRAKETLESKNILLEQQLIEIEQKTKKLREKDVQLLMMDRIAGIGTLAAGIAHEINNPMGFIKSNTNSIKKSTQNLIRFLSDWELKPEDQFLPEIFHKELDLINFNSFKQTLNSKYDRIERGIERIIQIVNSLRNFSRIDNEDVGKLDINKSIQEAIELLKPSNKTIMFQTMFEAAPMLECVASEINQCLMHVIKNAIDAIDTDKTGEIIIKTSVIAASDTIPKNQIRIQVIDNGIGMTENVLNQAFNPFFTTKSVGSGSGIGLTITENIIKRHHGSITITSTAGKGTTVDIYIAE
ncbi:MAG: hybrid sensor histidine kinase/response regulator [Desulfobacterales bacterium]|nr:hybrid sensor histidine kinase/response regulator [Desulfobacterales bacterium]